MCGIAGIVRLTDLESPSLSPVDNMLDLLQHRGPDERGTWVEGPVALGHTRLSIIDTHGSHQPLLSDRAVLSYNGEVFNYEELREKLPGPWTTRGDTEVLNRLLATEGVTGLRRVRGQFAFARWDAATRTLTLARDALGVLPLFWWSDGRTLVFASEIDALLRGLPTRPEIDRHGLSHYLGYRAVPAPRTLWQGVHKLPPGHSLQITLGTQEPVLEDWRDASPSPNHSISFAEAVSMTRTALEDAVSLSLVSDVPVGAYLSGGLDSSLITALAQRRQSSPLRTYCASFGDDQADESSWARQVAEHVGTTHVDVRVDPQSFLAEWPRLSRLRGAPVSEPSDIAVHQLALRASQDVKVVLSGEGSDELFAGYPKHRMARATRYAGMIPTTMRRTVVDSLGPHLHPRARRPLVALRALAQPDEDSRIRGWFASFTPAERAELLGTSYDDPPFVAPPSPDTLARMLRHDQEAWLSDNLLERGDRMTMGASVELRPPFLDPEVVQVSRRIPSRLHVHRGTSKAVLRSVAEDLLPPKILNRPKAGFQVPISSWLRHELAGELQERLLSAGSFSSQHLNHEAVHRLVSRHLSGKTDASRALWTLLSLEMWADNYA